MNFHEVANVRRFLESFIQKADDIIKEDLTAKSSEEKERYYSKIRQIDSLLSGANFFSELEKFYLRIIDNIKKNDNGWKQFLPNFLIRLGYSLLSQERFDDGFSRILQAYRIHYNSEDIIKKESDFDIFKQRIRNILYTKISYYTVFRNGQKYYERIPSYFNSFDLEDQIYLIRIILKFDQHSSIIRTGDNLSSRTVLFACLGDLCIFIESYLRKQLLGSVSSKRITLFNLIEKFGSVDPCNWYEKFNKNRVYIEKGQRKKICENTNYTQFNRNLRRVFAKSEKSIEKAIGKYFLLLYCTRNFVGHQFILRYSRSEFLYTKLKGSNKLYKIESVFWKIFATLLYIYSNRTHKMFD